VRLFTETQRCSRDWRTERHAIINSVQEGLASKLRCRAFIVGGRQDPRYLRRAGVISPPSTRATNLLHSLHHRGECASPIRRPRPSGSGATSWRLASRC
jgi:hypothetical protein